MATDPAIASVFESLRKGLTRAVRRIVPAPEVEDIVQEVYIRICLVEKRSQIESPGAFMFEIARNLAKDHVKRAEFRLVETTGDEHDLSSRSPRAEYDQTVDCVAATQEFSMFCHAVRDLPAQCRRAFVLRKVYGYSQREIAKAMGISEKTVEKHIASGIQRCMTFLNRPTQHRSATDNEPTRNSAGRRSGRHS